MSARRGGRRQDTERAEKRTVDNDLCLLFIVHFRFDFVFNQRNIIVVIIVTFFFVSTLVFGGKPQLVRLHLLARPHVAPPCIETSSITLFHTYCCRFHFPIMGNCVSNPSTKVRPGPPHPPSSRSSFSVFPTATGGGDFLHPSWRRFSRRGRRSNRFVPSISTFVSPPRVRRHGVVLGRGYSRRSWLSSFPSFQTFFCLVVPKSNAIVDCN